MVEEAKNFSSVSEMKVKKKDFKADQIPMNLIGDMNQEGEKSLSSEMKPTEALKDDLHAYLQRVNDDLAKKEATYLAKSVSAKQNKSFQHEKTSKRNCLPQKKSYACTKCTNSFRKKKKLVKHFKNFHMHNSDSEEIKHFSKAINASKDKGNPKKPYRCAKCMQGFRKKKELVIHFKNFHMHKLDSDEIKQFMEVIGKYYSTYFQNVLNS